MASFNGPDWFGICLTVLLMGMSKGGFPVSGVSLPILVLLWPEQAEAGHQAVSFMLPLLCVMDIIGAFLYRGRVDWKHIKGLLPATLAGVIVASLFFVSNHGFSVSDRTLKLAIGFFGLFFCALRLRQKKVHSIFSEKSSTLLKRSHRQHYYGFAAGFSSTIAHAAGPVMQMYFLGTNLAKTEFAATTVYYFLLLNLAKVLPFTLYSRFNSEQLIADLWVLPVIPLGVLLGYALVRMMREQHYLLFIQLTLAATSALLVIRTLINN